MALNPEEMKKRRQEQAQKRARQAQQRKKLLIKCAIAAGALLLCVVLLVVLGGKKDSAPPVSYDPTGTLGTQPNDSPTTVIHLAATGDLNVTDSVVASGGSTYDYTDAFLDVTALLADADVTALNFEGNLCGAPYGSSSLSAPQSLVQSLRRSGVDLLQLANSYSINQGVSGLRDTIDAGNRAGLDTLGAYANRAELKKAKGYTIRNVNGVKVAFVAFTKGMNGMRLPADSTGCVNVLYTDYDSTYQTVDTQGITSILKAAQKEDPDLIVAMLHWGSEFNNTISESQEQIVSLMKNNGVDAIIGTHSHYVQKISYDPESGFFVAYSLGDFFGDAQRAGSEYSIIVDLEITKDNRSGDTRITGYDYTPIFTVREDDRPSRVVRIREAMAAFDGGYLNRVSQQTYDAMAYALSRIEARVSGN